MAVGAGVGRNAQRHECLRDHRNRKLGGGHDGGITQRDIAPFLPPKHEQIVRNKTEIHFFGYYKSWDPQENFYYCQENTGFTPNPERTEGTYSKYASLDDRIDGYHYYLAFIKFGIGRTTSDSAHEIRDNKITREEGVALQVEQDLAAGAERGVAVVDVVLQPCPRAGRHVLHRDGAGLGEILLADYDPPGASSCRLFELLADALPFV